jgi:carbamoyl-phosphate synthase large subunit
VTGVPMVDLATRCMMGHKLRDLGYSSGLWTLEKVTNPISQIKNRIIPESDFVAGTAKIPAPILYAVKAPVFSFQKLTKVEPSLGPEMKSTGEILGIDNTYEGALYKALVASGITFKGDGLVLITVRDEDKPKATEIARELHKSGRKLAATKLTADALKKAGVPCEVVQRISQGSPNILELVLSGKVSLMINTPSNDKIAEKEAALIRRACIETGIPCVTSIDTAGAIMRALDVFADPSKATCKRLEEYFTPA